MATNTPKPAYEFTDPALRLTQAEDLITKMVAIHAAAYHPDVGPEAYPGERHEWAEEQWCSEARRFLGMQP